MNTILSSGAELELEDAVEHYEGCQLGLGLEFKREVDGLIKQILASPNIGTKLKKGCRRRRLSKFPYGIVYRQYPHVLRILAIMHLSRRPGYWMERLDPE